MQVADFMTRRVLAVTPDTPMRAAARLMLDHKISGLPVVDAAGHVVGIVSEHDLLRRRGDGEWEDGSRWLALMIEPEGLADQRAHFDDRKVSEVMTRNPVTVAAGASLNEASRLIEDRGIKRLPVVENGVLVGVIARADLVRALAQSAERARAATAHDVSVVSRLAELERQIWRGRARLLKPF
jgi:CBS domain-containing protein